ncbi:bacterial transferase hexapeptide [Colletotrichum karsti]|uniref:Bacterial transferase hexapeptide n=1 Tax=Colletotrichum karsti TaxID=1095194 RepID=A0A9P6LEC2_9PEZI|nr:bacterial transferase hexapeptide [Colletotrichum karsti]KAF9869941.1 bacterial transferase hexapeptide [Colletotrichum karsti]
MSEPLADPHSFHDGVSYPTTQGDFTKALDRCAKACEEFNQLGATATSAQRSDAWRRIVCHNVEGDGTPYIKSPITMEYELRVYIAPGTFINHNCTILDTPVADIRIGTKCTIGPHVSIYGVSHSLNPDETGRRAIFGKPVTIGDAVWIGGRAIILAGVQIGSRSTIAAGSVVRSDIPSDCIAAGVPAKVIRFIRPDETHDALYAGSLEEALEIRFTHDADRVAHIR